MIGVQTCPSEENNVGVEQTYDRSGQLDKRSDAVHNEIKMLNIDNELIRERNEENMDFKIPGLPHSTVKQMQSANDRELFIKSRTIRIDKLFNETSQESKQMIDEVGNIEPCEFLDTEPKTQCKRGE